MLLTGAGGFPFAPATGGGWSGPTSGLTHRWPMDDANVSGTTITDVVGALNGTAGSGVSSAAGPSGTTARAFDGTLNSYITLPSDPFAAHFSIGFWGYITDITAGASTDGRDQTFVNFGTENMRLACARTSDAAFNGCLGSANQTTTSASAVFVNGTWEQIVMTFDGTTYLFYANGSALTMGGADPGYGIPATNIIGARDTAEANIAGRMRQVVVYNRALSAGEVTTLYNAN